MKIPIKFLRLKNGKGINLPKRATSGSAAFDICSAEDSVLTPGIVYSVRTGFACEVLEGYELIVCPRSGMAKQGVTIINSPGTIDSDYRGEIKILLISTRHFFSVVKGDRIAQIKLREVLDWEPLEVDSLYGTKRGTGGFGSTGK